jgi:hypothetical protein
METKQQRLKNASTLVLPSWHHIHDAAKQLSTRVTNSAWYMEDALFVQLGLDLSSMAGTHQTEMPISEVRLRLSDGLGLNDPKRVIRKRR